MKIEKSLLFGSTPLLVLSLLKEGDKYGHGSVEGLAVSSAANNGVIGGAMTTMLTLGLPGTR